MSRLLLFNGIRVFSSLIRGICLGGQERIKLRFQFNRLCMIECTVECIRWIAKWDARWHEVADGRVGMVGVEMHNA